jgi:nicotinamidase-related amidase
MTKDLGVWTADDCTLVLIDYQKEMFKVIRSETSADLVEMHVRLLARAATGFDMPIILSTVGVGLGFNGPTLPSIESELDGIGPIDRTSMNAFEDEAFRAAVEATGRKRLIVGGLHTEICLTFATVQALKDGYDVLYVTDAVGGRSQTAHRTAIERLAHAGAVPTTALAVVTECSATGRARWPGRPRTSSTGTSTKSPRSLMRSALPRPRRLRRQLRWQTDVTGVMPTTTVVPRAASVT